MTDKFLIGHADDAEKGTGVTVLLALEGATGGVSVRGAAPGTRETDLLRCGNTVEKINAVVLAGGSAFGLESCCGVMDYLRERGVGYDAGGFKVPIVCGAVLYDLEYKAFAYPDKKMGYLAASTALAESFQCGNVGAGTGATIGKILGMTSAAKGGLGVYSVKIGEIEVTAVIAVNAMGDVYGKDGKIIAGAKAGGEFVDTMKLLTGGAFSADVENLRGKNTTIGCILTNAKLNKEQANKLADIAHDGYAEAIRPVHTMFDGDTIFAMASGEKKGEFLQICAAAVEATAAAVRIAVANAPQINEGKSNLLKTGLELFKKFISK
ncbi:MAG: P1 family peptidase [Clostridiales bacterium]|jgi:L-aminopeptidase/D-esterase-like protein|nr:P1 family peptidase [Clostridiales bacterium]